MIADATFQSALLEHLAPVRSLLDDPTVREILINGPDEVFVERGGVRSRTEHRFDGPARLLALLRCAAQCAGQAFDATHPLLVVRLPDGSRVQAAMAPVAPLGPVVSIRRATATRRRLAELTTAPMATELCSALRDRRNLLVVGPAGAGKTGALGALLAETPPDERIVVVESGRELELGSRHAVYLTQSPSVSARELLRAATRLGPDRLVVGEVEGDEAFDYVQASCGRAASCLASLQAAGAEEALWRLEALCLGAEKGLPSDLVRRGIGAGIDLVVTLSRGRILSLTACTSFDPQRQRYVLAPAASGPKPGTNVQPPATRPPAIRLDNPGPKASLPLPFPRTRAR